MHAYTPTGEPRHTVIGRNGKERPTTIADCRKHGWLPSVTTVLRYIPANALNEWLLRSLAEEAYLNPPLAPEEDFDICYKFWRDRMDTRQQDTLDLGTLVHQTLEAALANQTWFPDQPVGDRLLCEYVNPALELMHDNGFVCERNEVVLVSDELGVAGTTDVILSNGDLLDFKTKKTKPDQSIRPYEQYPMQLAAYYYMLHGDIPDHAQCHNLYISSTEVGRVNLVTYKAKELRHYMRGFRLLNDFYRWHNAL
jgi:hypothetical protein